MRTDTKANIILGTFIAGAVALVGLIVLMAVNEAFGEATPYGEPYLASYSYCQTTSYGAKGTSWCSSYATGHEWRQNTHIKGFWFDMDSYKVVDKR